MIEQESNRDPGELGVRSRCLPLERSLQNFYLQEVYKGLKQIDQALSKLQGDASNLEGLQQIKNTVCSIADLAMIYGYEGVEKIAVKLFIAVQRLEAEDRFHPAIVTKIQSAVMAIRDVTGMEAEIERQMSVERSNSRVELQEKKVQNCAEQVSRSFEELFEEPAPASNENERLEIHHGPTGENKQTELLFDINESDLVIRVTDL